MIHRSLLDKVFYLVSEDKNLEMLLLKLEKFFMMESIC